MTTKSPQLTGIIENPDLLKASHVLIVDAPYYSEISERLVAGTAAVLESFGVSYERVCVPGALEIPQAIAAAVDARSAGQKRFDGAIAIGCVVRGETAHFDIVCRNANDGIMEVALRSALPIGNAVLTVDTMDQARSRAEGENNGKGGDAALACLRLIELRRQFAKAQ